MNLHEYQAKALLKDYHLTVQNGIPVSTPEDAAKAFEQFEQLSGKTAVIKAQVYAGGRGKAGGVKVVRNKEEAKNAASNLLGKRLVTHQTGPEGLPIHTVFICEDVYPVKSELYLGAVIDRASRRVTFMASTEGGVEIEKVAQETPEKIIKIQVDPLLGLMDYQAREVGYQLKLDEHQIKQFIPLMQGLYQAFIDKDFSLVEINPLSVKEDGTLICVDAKINIDSNALYRHLDLEKLHDRSQENERELKAADYGLNYVALEGQIGCMVNGAGLAMATMDIIKLYGGEPANFLDVGGSADKEKVVEAFKIILGDASVKAVFINIFGGIVRCDMIAYAIIEAVKEVDVKVPVVVRLEGNRSEEGRKLLDQSGLKLIAAEGFADGAKKVVAAVSNQA